MIGPTNENLLPFEASCRTRSPAAVAERATGRQTGAVFRRKVTAPPPEWRERFDAARELIASQSPPPWMIERLDALDRMLIEAESDHARLGATIVQLDLDRATRELKDALRSQSTMPSPRSQRVVDSLQARYETIHDLMNRQVSIRRTIDEALVDVDLLAVRSVELGARADRWQVDDTVERLRLEMTALELAHRELADL
jgi:hypothetical protein